MEKGREVREEMSGLVDLLSPRYNDEEQVHAKQMQKGYSVLKGVMEAQGRVIVTVHGSPEAVILRYQDLKALWTLVNDLVDQAENSTLVALAADRLRNQREERIPLEQALADMREMMRGTAHHED